MQAPTTHRRGLKSVGDGFLQQPHGAATESFESSQESFQAWMISPFHKPDGPGLWRTLTVIFLVILTVLANAWIYHAVLDGLLKSTLIPGASDFMIRALLMGLTAAAMFLVFSGWWSFDTDLPTIIYPEIAIAFIVSRSGRLGLVVSLVYCGIIFGISAAAGAILRILNVVAPNAGIINVATDPNGRVLYWFGTFLFVFSVLLSRNFLNHDESPMKAYHRSIKAGAGVLFVIITGFASNGLRSFSASQYVTASIATGNNVDWPFYVFVAFLAAPATAMAIYILLSWLLAGTDIKIFRHSVEKKVDGDIEMPINASARVNRKLNVQF